MTLAYPTPAMTPLDRIFALEAVRVTEAAAIAAAHETGRGDEAAADRAAVTAMHDAFNALPIAGTVTIGEGEQDEAPMLYLGEKVGLGGQEVALGLNALEGATYAAKAMGGALTVMAMAEPGGFLAAPDIYMDKIAIGPGYAEGLVDLDAEPGDNVNALARARGVSPREITALVMDRPRHETLIAKLRQAGAAVKLIADGDVAAVLELTEPATGVDIYMGRGRAPKGVLAAAALRCVGGQMQARLAFRNDAERRQAAGSGIADTERKYALGDLVSGDVVFSATGVTDGPLLSGVRQQAGCVATESVVMRSATGTVRFVRTRHRRRLG